VSTRIWESDWVLKRSLDGGGQGSTFLVTSRSDEKTVGVLKELKKNDSKEARIRMFQEVNNLRVVHTAGAKVPRYIAGNTERYEDATIPLFFVMEFVDGPTLAKLIQDSGPIPLAPAVRIVLDLSESIRIGHSKNVLHRDIKPRNIVVRCQEPADAVILDYGLSFNLEESQDITSLNETIENSFFSLPEGRAPGENRRDPRSDLAALCGILYHCLTGHNPGIPEDSHGNPPHRRSGFGLPEQLVESSAHSRLMAFFDRGLSGRMSSRFQTSADLKARLEELLSTDIPESFDDPVEIARQMSEELLKADRATQLHEFSQRIHAPLQQVRVYVEQNSKKLGQFRLGMASSYPSQLSTIPPGTEQIPNQFFITMLSASAQKTDVYITLNFGADAEECAVYPGIFAHSRTNQIVKQLNVYSPTYRWQGLRGPDPQQLVQVYKRALSSAMQLFLQHLKSPPSQ
jgi:serine/threonine protein kinase